MNNIPTKPELFLEQNSNEKSIANLLKEPGCIKTAETLECFEHGGIKFFANFDLSGLSDEEILSKQFKFDVDYNGLIDVKLDGGMGLANQYGSGVLTGETVLTPEQKAEAKEEYNVAYVNLLRCCEDESKTTLIVKL